MAGGLVAAGARLASGAELIADAVELYDLVEETDVVITGEGRVDDTSFAGKVVGSVLTLAAAAERTAVVVAGVVDASARVRLDDAGVGWIDLVECYGEQRALAETASCVAESVSDWLLR